MALTVEKNIDGKVVQKKIYKEDLSTYLGFGWKVSANPVKKEEPFYKKVRKSED